MSLTISACAESCSIGRALYVAIVHNSGAPPKHERDAMDARSDSLMRRVSSLRIVVLPVAVLGRDVTFDTAAAATLATQLNALGGIDARVSPEPATLPLERQPNEALIYWTRFKALAANVAAHPHPNTDLVMLVDVIGVPTVGNLAAVHVMSTTGTGAMAYGRLWNSRQARYREIMPRSLDDVAGMVAADVRDQRPPRSTAMNERISVSPAVAR